MSTYQELESKYGGMEKLYERMLDDDLPEPDRTEAWQKCAGSRWLQWLLDSLNSPRLAKARELLNRYVPGHFERMLYK